MTSGCGGSAEPLFAAHLPDTVFKGKKLIGKIAQFLLLAKTEEDHEAKLHKVVY